MAEIGVAAKAAIPGLLEALRYDPENYVSQPYLEALAAINCHSPETESVIVSIVDDLSATEILIVANMLLSFGVFREEVSLALRSIQTCDEEPEIHARSAALCSQLEELKGRSG